MKRSAWIFLALVLAATAGAPSRPARADETRVKYLLQEALRLYGEKQYVRALDLFRQVEDVDPGNETAVEYIKSTQQRIEEWERQNPESGAGSASPTWESLLNPGRNPGETLTNAKDIIAARRSLVEKMRNRSTNTDNIVQIQESKGGMDVTLYHDQLFLPGLRTLRDESLPILANVADLIRQGPDREITVKSVARHDSKDPYLLYPETPEGSPENLPGMGAADSAFLFQDIEAVRAFILFTHLAQLAMAPQDAVRQGR